MTLWFGVVFIRESAYTRCAILLEILPYFRSENLVNVPLHYLSLGNIELTAISCVGYVLRWNYIVV